MTPSRARIRKFILALCLTGAPLACILTALCIGRYPVPVSDVITVVGRHLSTPATSAPDMLTTIIRDIRMPRALLGALVGGCLAVSGAAFQGLFQNPLVSAGILGVSSGAGFGAALAIVLLHSTTATYPFALLFGILAVLVSCSIGRLYNTTPVIMLVLGGVIVSAIFSALLSFVKYTADPYNELPAIVFWLMGSLAGARYRDIMVAGGPMLLGVAGLLLLRWRINVLSMGEREARSLGLATTTARALIICCATLATAGAVCVSGVIGWIGLVIPHIGRMLVGSDNRVLIPASFSLGACFLVIVDTLGRMLTGAEFPRGFLTALIGGPFFASLLKKTKGGGW